MNIFKIFSKRKNKLRIENELLKKQQASELKQQISDFDVFVKNRMVLKKEFPNFDSLPKDYATVAVLTDLLKRIIILENDKNNGK